ncbi:MAG: hypothetical protein ABI178_07460 [Rhodanobacter sp.]
MGSGHFWQTLFLHGSNPWLVVLWGAAIGPLIIPPILNIYRKYYGDKPTLFLFISLYLLMVVAAHCEEGIFFVLGWLPAGHAKAVGPATISLNYTSVLDIVFFAVAALLLVTFWRTGGPNDAQDGRRWRARSPGMGARMERCRADQANRRSLLDPSPELKVQGHPDIVPR